MGENSMSCRGPNKEPGDFGNTLHYEYADDTGNPIWTCFLSGLSQWDPMLRSSCFVWHLYSVAGEAGASKSKVAKPHRRSHVPRT